MSANTSCIRLFRGCVAVATLLFGWAAPGYAQGLQCRNSANIPLPDLTRSYRGLGFGLYPGGRTTPPDGHLAVGLDRAENRIQPLDVDGNPSPGGRVVLMSIGMSNTSSEFGQFVRNARQNPAINPKLTILNGSLSGADAAMWTDPNSPPWRNALSEANSRGTSANQVQVIWIKQAHLQTVPFPEEVRAFREDLESILGIAKRVFPNLQIAYVSSRTRAGAETRRGPGEPQAYETAFAVKQLIEDQIAGVGVGLDTAWLSWGPYLWSNGTPRSDGFVWSCGDLLGDLLHPSATGDQKVADQLMAFFMTRETATPWFLDPSHASAELGGEIAASQTAGIAPLTVEFAADVPDASDYFWSFEDGTFATARDPQKTFHIDGVYDVRLTITDEAGNWSHSKVEIRVGETGQ